MLQKGKPGKAVSCYQDLSKDFPTYIRSYIRLAEICYLKKEKNKAFEYANKAIDLNLNEAYAPVTYLSNKMSSNGDTAMARVLLSRLSGLEPEKKSKEKGGGGKIQYAMQTYADARPVPGVELLNMGDSINSFENEYLPSVSLDGKTMVFTRRAGGNEDFYYSTLDTNGVWTKAKNLGYPPNTSMPDGGAKLSADGHYLFYTRCDMPSPDGIIGGGCDLVFSYRDDTAWSSPQYFGFTLNTTAYEGQPCISSDNKDLYFVSNRDGGYGGMDIWVSHFENRYWSKPVNLGPSVNTAKDETAPYIHPDNETLYFSSNGHAGLGESDLFISRRNKNGTWKKPINLGAPINTKQFEGSLVVNARGTMAWCAADRAEGKGGLDIYHFETYPAIQPVPTLCVSGYLIDKYYKTRLFDRPITFTYTFNNTLVGEIKSNEGDASYCQALQMGKTYVISVNEEGYRPYYKTLKLTSDTLPDILQMDIRLRQPGITDTLFRGSVFLDSTHFHLDSLYYPLLDSMGKAFPAWAEDSAHIQIRLTAFTSWRDSEQHPAVPQDIKDAQLKLNLVKKQLNDRKIPYWYMTQAILPSTKKEEPEQKPLSDQIDILVVEEY